MPHRERGAALIFVLLIIAMLSIIAVQINEQLRFNVKRLDNQRQNNQAYWYAIGGEQLARALLQQLETDKPVHLGQPWATEDAIFPIEGGVLQGRVMDGQACFNLNNLLVVRNPGEEPPAETASEKQFISLMATLGMDAVRSQQLKDRIQDWLDPDFQVNGLYGAEDLEYSDRELAFLSANALMVAVSELNLLMELTQEELNMLDRLLCVLPATGTTININTLKVEQSPLLVALLNNLVNAEAAKQLLEQRPEQGWESVAQFLEDPALAGKTLPEDFKASLAVQSTYFRATINVLYYDTQFSLQSLMEVQDKNSRVLSRRYGELF